jgi:hypothetical protein
MKNTTKSNPTALFVTYGQVSGRIKSQCPIFLLLLPLLLMVGTVGLSAADQNSVPQAEEIVMQQVPQQSAVNATSPDSFQLNRFSINAAGAIDDSSTNYTLGLSMGQPVVGMASSASYQTGTGFWYGFYLFKPGDVNGDQLVDVGDVVYLINYLFKSGPIPNPLLSGDTNCDSNVDIGDVVFLINYLFRSGPAPSC